MHRRDDRNRRSAHSRTCAYYTFFHIDLDSVLKSPLGERAAQGIKPNRASHRHCERRSVSPAVRASVGMFFRGLRSTYGVNPCERERYSFSPGHWLPFAQTDCWQSRGNGADTSTVIVDIVVVEGAVIVHVRGVVLIVARRTQPPPPVQYRTQMNTLFRC